MARQTKSTPAPQAEVPDALATLRAMAEPGDWLSLALEHHDQIRSAFVVALQTPPGGGRISALKGLAMVLNGHSLAEEVVLYPALADLDEDQAKTAYDEQTEAKIQMARLEKTDPRSEDWGVLLEEVQGAVLAHMAEEETTWFVELKQSDENQAKLTARYKEEFERYTRTGSIATNGAWDGPPRAVVE